MSAARVERERSRLANLEQSLRDIERRYPRGIPALLYGDYSARVDDYNREVEAFNALVRSHNRLVEQQRGVRERLLVLGQAC